MKRSLLIALVAGGFVLLLAAPSMAVHKGAGDLACGGCHTMHNSQGWNPAASQLNAGGPADGSLLLLRANVTSRAEIHNLCFQCHAENGTQGPNIQQPHDNTAPKVYKTTNVWNGGSFDTIGAGGDFSSTGTFNGSTWALNTAGGDGTVGDCSAASPSLGRGHSLGCSNVTPPGAQEGAISALSCTSCHDPHGYRYDGVNPASALNVNLYRNLKGSAPGGGGGVNPDPDGPVILTNVYSYIGGVEALVSNPTGGTGTTFAGAGTCAGPAGLFDPVTCADADHYWPIYKDANNNNAYYRGAGPAVQDTNIAGWCAQCHDKWHEDGQGTNNKNPDFGAGANTNDWARHPVNNSIVDATPTSGAGVTITDFANYSGIGAPANVPAAQDTVPTGYDSALDANNAYYANDSADRVFCFSCHFVHGGPFYDNLRWDYLLQTAQPTTGGQTGNGVPQLIGCQQCHNR